MKRRIIAFILPSIGTVEYCRKWRCHLYSNIISVCQALSRLIAYFRALRWFSVTFDRDSDVVLGQGTSARRRVLVESPLARLDYPLTLRWVNYATTDTLMLYRYLTRISLRSMSECNLKQNGAQTRLWTWWVNLGV